MRTQLVFFGNARDSIEGTKRGLIAFTTLMVLDAIRFKTADYGSVISRKKVNIYSVIFVWLLLCSAIGVQTNPKDYKESMTYGALVGFVVYGVHNGINYAIMDNYPINIAIMDTAWGTFACAVAALAVYALYHARHQSVL
jgi:uncharacterized membrane protein